MNWQQKEKVIEEGASLKSWMRETSERKRRPGYETKQWACACCVTSCLRGFVGGTIVAPVGGWCAEIVLVSKHRWSTRMGNRRRFAKFVTRFSWKAPARKRWRKRKEKGNACWKSAKNQRFGTVDTWILRPKVIGAGRRDGLCCRVTLWCFGTRPKR